MVRLREPVEFSGEKGDLINLMLSSFGDVGYLSYIEFTRILLSLPLTGEGLSEPR